MPSRLVDVLPLSPMQEGMLFHALYDPNGPDVYTVQQLLDLSGPLDAPMLRTAAQALLDRHPNLRAGFPQVSSGTPVQAIPAEVAVDWTDLDLSGLDDAEAQAALERAAAEEYERRFDLARPPLLRFTLVRLAPRRHCLIVTNHHILLDGWSTPIVVRELFTLYAEQGDSAALPRVAPYREYLAWLAHQDREAARQAWRTELAGVDEATLLALVDPGRSPRIPQRVVIEAPEAVTAALYGQAQRHGVTVNAMLQAAWGVVLSRMTGLDDVTFGAIVSGRSPQLADVEHMVGLFINIVPVRVRVDGTQSLSALITDVQRRQSALTPHHHLGLSDIHQVTGMSELFDTMMVFENYPWDGDGPTHDIAVTPGTGLRVRPALERGRDATHYPLTLVAAPGRRLYLRLDYRADLFDRDAAQALLDRLLRLLTAVAENPEVPVGRVNLLTAAERDRLLVRWNGAAVAGEPARLPEQFEAQVAATPDAPAVQFDEITLSYAELNRRANRLAHALIAHGVGPESVVALLMHRSPHQVVAILAVLKAGAAHLPLDPAHPPARLSFMLRDAQPAVLLANRQTVSTIPDDVATPVLVVDDPAAPGAVETGPDTDPTDAQRTGVLTLASPAYVIYTSGSTGRPKAVQMTGLGVANVLRWHARVIGGGPGDRTAQFTALSFDVSVQEVLSALLSGKTLVVPGDDVRRDPQQFAVWLAEQRVGELFAPNLVVESVAEAAAELDVDIAPLRQVAQAGEALTLSRQVRRFFGRVPGRLLHNHYGPTEAQVLTAGTLPDDVDEWP
ncbi:non-ribosomal peptide synthetase, partial [Micromonospora sp. WMMD723]